MAEQLSLDFDAPVKKRRIGRPPTKDLTQLSEKELAQFLKARERDRRRRGSDKRRAWRIANDAKNREVLNQRMRDYRVAHLDELRAQARERWAARSPEQIAIDKAASALWRAENAELHRRNALRWYEEHKERAAHNKRVWELLNPDKKKTSGLRSRRRHREAINARARDRWASDKDALTVRRNKRYLERADEMRAWRSSYIKHRERTDPNFKLRRGLRARFLSALKRSGATGRSSAVRDLGCSIPEFREHIEALWTEGMSWENWKIDGWHLDHIRPLASFDLSDPAQRAASCHYTNLQPLWWQDNLRKGSRYAGTLPNIPREGG